MTQNLNFLSKDFESNNPQGAGHQNMNLHNKALSVSFLDIGNNGPNSSNSNRYSLGNHANGNGQFGTVKQQTINASPSTAMAILSPPASRYAFEKGSGPNGVAAGPQANAAPNNPSLFNPGSKPNYSNLGNDWALNMNFSLSKHGLTPELSKRNSAEELTEESEEDVVNGTKFHQHVNELKGWLDELSLKEKHLFIDELIDYFLFSPNHSTDLINYLKVKIDRVSFNDDMDSPDTENVPSHQPSLNNLDSMLASTALEDSFTPTPRFQHFKSNLVHVTSNTKENNPPAKQVLHMSSKDSLQPQVFSPLLTESGFLQNQAIRYANESRHSHTKSASISNLNVNTTPSALASNDMLSPGLLSPINALSLSSKRGNNLSINTNVSGAGPASASAVQTSSNPLASPNSPITPGGYNLDGLDPQTRLKLQALSTINSRSKLDALKKTAYSESRTTPVQSSAGSKQYARTANVRSTPSKYDEPILSLPSNRKRNGNSISKQDDESLLKLSFSKKRYDDVTTTPLAKPPSVVPVSTPSKNLAEALKTALEPELSTPAKRLTSQTLALLSPKSPGLNSLELIELKYLSDLPIWLKNLRLHKYTKILENYKWKELVYLSDSELELIGVTALGARRKLLKAFDIVKVAYENGDIIGLEN